MTDREFTMAFWISIGVHLFLLMVQLPLTGWLQGHRQQPRLDVVYEYARAQEELQRLTEQLGQLEKERRQALAAPAPTSGIGQPQIRIPDRSLLSPEPLLPEATAARAAVVDLTNLVEAAEGNPVLLSYFTAIREQIQLAANNQTWMTGQGQSGMVFVSFVLTSKGQLQSATVVGDRSAPSQRLRNIALEIVTSAEPFPPFPPSMPDARKTIIVPLEFLLGS